MGATVTLRQPPAGTPQQICAAGERPAVESHVNSWGGIVDFERTRLRGASRRVLASLAARLDRVAQGRSCVHTGMVFRELHTSRRASVLDADSCLQRLAEMAI